NGQTHGIEAVTGNHVSRKRKLRERINHVRAATRKIAFTFERGRYVCDACDTFAQAPPFIVGEKESPVTSDWAANRATELVALVLRALLRGRSEEVSRIRDAIPKELVCSTVQLVRAAL